MSSKVRLYSLLAMAAALLLSACSSPQICERPVTKSDPEAVALLDAAQRAQGNTAFKKVHDVSVSYEGKWASIGPRFQPVLVDKSFRGSSEERLILGGKTMIAQQHKAASGVKRVVRAPGSVAVSYNDSISNIKEKSDAAALVADAYTMFLLGPHYFHRAGVTVTNAGQGKVDGVFCDQVMTVLRPGFGVAKEDRVLLSIDQADKRLLRVRMTLNGLESTKGAEVDVTFREFRRIGGVLWPTDFDERIRVPFDLHAHHWRMTGLDLNRGFNPSDLSIKGFIGRAAMPARTIP
jgi:hypothetical protein